MNKLTPNDLLEEMIEHARLDNFIQGVWIDDGKGCMWGCTMQTETDAIEKACELYQIPKWLGFLAEAIFEGLDIEDAKSWPVDCIKAFGEYEGDVERIKHELAILRLTPLAANNTSVSDAINGVIDCHKKFLASDLDIDWTSACEAAYSAASSAAYSAASSAAYSAAESAAAADSAAQSAGYVAAYSAAWSADSGGSSEPWRLEADNLLKFLRKGSK